VNELIKSALLPVLRDRLERAGLPVIAEAAIGETTGGMLEDYTNLTEEQKQAAEEAILNITVCDPAAGSGHFLIKANDALAAELARICTGHEYPSQDEIQNAKHDVLVHCIYAVDLNPMAVELCKVSLWINASVTDKPLSFLDHHIKCGNSLIGTTPELMANGIPHEAFSLGLAGDDRDVAKTIRKRNREERKQYEETKSYQIPLRAHKEMEAAEGALWEYISRLADSDPKRAREAYASYLSDQDYQRKKQEADFWTAAFFWPMMDLEECDHQDCGLHGSNGEIYAPTYGEFAVLIDKGAEALPVDMIMKVEVIVSEHRFFHWYLEFDEVFRGEGGFDVVLGNPPWERVKLQEKEFFFEKAPEIASASTAARRRKLINELSKGDPDLFQEFKNALHGSECNLGFLRNSSRYPLTAVGDLNSYQIFTGLVRQIISGKGRIGIVIPSGIATDYYNQEFISLIIENRELVSLFDFENRAGLFPGTHRSYRYCLFTLSGIENAQADIDFAFFLYRTDDLALSDRHYSLTFDDIKLLNPNTRTCPTFRSRKDAELTKKTYRIVPVLVDENENRNPWMLHEYYEFHMSQDSEHFSDSSGLNLPDRAVPLYEAKLIHQFDHRYANYEPSHDEYKETSLDRKADPTFRISTRYYVPRKAFHKYVERHHLKQDWFISYRKVTNATNERTVIFAATPFYAAGESMHRVSLFAAEEKADLQALFICNCNSFVLDYLARQKLGGPNLAKYVLEQLPILPPDRYSPRLVEFAIPRALELVFTAWDIKPFADDVRNYVLSWTHSMVIFTGSHGMNSITSWRHFQSSTERTRRNTASIVRSV
jgi:hypothetical protein